MITLPQHCELLSDAWLEEARELLGREVAARRERLAGQTFSLSERFTHAPPHLKLAGDVAAWNVRFDGEKVSVARGFDERADQVVEGDYQAALALAQCVGALVPGALAAQLREVATLYGKDAIRVRGALASAAARDLAAALHDHMARRTVENPDLAHRAARQGIAHKVRELEEHGYAVLENAISPEFADELRAETQRAVRTHGSERSQQLGPTGLQLQWMLYHGRAFERLAQHPKLLTLIDASLGRGAVIASLSAIEKGPGKTAIPVHTDYALVPEPYPDWAVTGVGVWALEDWRAESGPTWVLPGSHRLRRGPRPGETHPPGVPIEMPKGSVVFFTHGLWHWQGDRSEPGERVTLHWHFNRGIFRSLEFKRTDPQLLHRNAPRLAEMLGEHDGFDTTEGIGRDYARMDYMGRLLRFNEQQKQRILRGEV
jgi:ectoine hydroxylase-related dioxygenase (phytanoyl-CoA dioxygenase family)